MKLYDSFQSSAKQNYAEEVTDQQRNHQFLIFKKNENRDNCNSLIVVRFDEENIA